MWKPAIPDAVLEKLRCSLCNEYLSQMPVYSYPDQQGAGCGRCPLLEEQNPIRDINYETVAKFIRFPCRYNAYGCLEQELPAHIQTHEESCLYKQYFCPFMPLGFCPWQGPSSELYAHYEDKHDVLALKNPTFEIDLINKYEDNYLLFHFDALFIVHVKCDAKENIFWCSVRYVGSKPIAEQYLYQIEFGGQNGLIAYKLPKKVVEYDNSMSLDKTTAVSVETKKVREDLGDPSSIICHICISQNDALPKNAQNGDCSNSSLTTSIEGDGVDEELLRELECPVCNEYMVPPIHQCVAGHSICSACKQRVRECPTCREQIADTRNFSLESMTKIIKYYCKYRDFDCKFVSNSVSIKNHESECKFGPYECPLKDLYDCKWKGKLSDVMNHAVGFHKDNVLDIEYVNVIFDEDEDEDCFVIGAYNEVFKLIYKFEHNYFYWCVQLVGPADDSKKYMFEVDLIDNSNGNQRVFIKRDCSQLTKYANVFDQGASFIKLPFSLLQPLISGGDLTYKCHVIKK